MIQQTVGSIRDTASNVRGQVMGFFNRETSTESYDNRSPDLSNLQPNFGNNGNLMAQLGGHNMFNSPVVGLPPRMNGNQFDVGLSQMMNGNQFDVQSLIRAAEQREQLNQLQLQQQKLLTGAPVPLNYIQEHGNIFSRTNGMPASLPYQGLGLGHSTLTGLHGFPNSQSIIPTGSSDMHLFRNSLNMQSGLPSSLISLNGQGFVGNSLRRQDSTLDSTINRHGGPIRRFDSANPFGQLSLNPNRGGSAKPRKEEQLETLEKLEEIAKVSVAESKNENSGTISQSNKSDNLQLSNQEHFNVGADKKSGQLVGDDGTAHFLEVPRQNSENRRLRRPLRRRRKGVTIQGNARGRHMKTGNIQMQLPHQQGVNRDQKFDSSSRVESYVDDNAQRDGFRKVKPDSIIQPTPGVNGEPGVINERKDLQLLSDKLRAYNHKYSSSIEEKQTINDYFNPTKQASFRTSIENPKNLLTIPQNSRSPFLDQRIGPHNFFPNSDRQFMNHFLFNPPNAYGVSRGIGEGVTTYQPSIPIFGSGHNYSTNFKVFDLGNKMNKHLKDGIPFSTPYRTSFSSSTGDNINYADFNLRSHSKPLYNKDSDDYLHHNFYGYTNPDAVSDLRERSYPDQQQRFTINGNLHRKINEPQTLPPSTSKDFYVRSDKNKSVIRKDFTSPAYHYDILKGDFNSPQEIGNKVPSSIKEIIDSPMTNNEVHSSQNHPLRPLIMDIFEELQLKSPKQSKTDLPNQKQIDRIDYGNGAFNIRNSKIEEVNHSINQAVLGNSEDKSAESGLKIRPASFEVIEIYSKNRQGEKVPSIAEDFGSKRMSNENPEEPSDHSQEEPINSRVRKQSKKKSSNSMYRNDNYETRPSRQPTALLNMFDKKQSLKTKHDNEFSQPESTTESSQITTIPFIERRRNGIQSKTRRNRRRYTTIERPSSVEYRPTTETNFASTTTEKYIVSKVISQKPRRRKISSFRKTLSAELDEYSDSKLHSSDRKPINRYTSINRGAENQKKSVANNDKTVHNSGENSSRRRMQTRGKSDISETAGRAGDKIKEMQREIKRTFDEEKTYDSKYDYDEKNNRHESKEPNRSSFQSNTGSSGFRGPFGSRRKFTRPSMNSEELPTYDYSLERKPTDKYYRAQNHYSLDRTRPEYDRTEEDSYYYDDDDPNYISAQEIRRTKPLIQTTTSFPEDSVILDKDKIKLAGLMIKNEKLAGKDPQFMNSVEQLKFLRDKISASFQSPNEAKQNQKLARQTPEALLSSFTLVDAIQPRSQKKIKSTKETMENRNEPDIITIDDVKRTAQESTQRLVGVSFSTGKNQNNNGFEKRHLQMYPEEERSIGRHLSGSVINVSPYSNTKLAVNRPSSFPVTFVDPSGRVNNPVHAYNLQTSRPLTNTISTHFGSIENIQKLHLSPTDLFAKDSTNFASIVMNNGITYGGVGNSRHNLGQRSAIRRNDHISDPNIITGKILTKPGHMPVTPTSSNRQQPTRPSVRNSPLQGNFIRDINNMPFESLTDLQPMKLVADDPQSTSSFQNSFLDRELTHNSRVESNQNNKVKRPHNTFKYNNVISFGQNYQGIGGNSKFVKPLQTSVIGLDVSKDKLTQNTKSNEMNKSTDIRNTNVNKAQISSERRNGSLWLQREIALVKSGLQTSKLH